MVGIQCYPQVTHSHSLESPGLLKKEALEETQHSGKSFLGTFSPNFCPVYRNEAWWSLYPFTGTNLRQRDKF